MRWWTGDEHNIINNPHHGWNWSWCPASSNKNCKNNYGSYFIRPVVPSWVLLCVLPCVHEDNNWVLLLAVQKQGPSRAANLNLHTKGDFLYYKSAADHSHQIISIFMQISQWRWWWGATHPEATTWVRTHSQVSTLDLWFDQMLHEARGIKGCALTLSLQLNTKSNPPVPLHNAIECKPAKTEECGRQAGRRVLRNNFATKRQEGVAIQVQFTPF